jgi:hypothetical protein
MWHENLWATKGWHKSENWTAVTDFKRQKISTVCTLCLNCSQTSHIANLHTSLIQTCLFVQRVTYPPMKVAPCCRHHFRYAQQELILKIAFVRWPVITFSIHNINYKKNRQLTAGTRTASREYSVIIIRTQLNTKECKKECNGANM